MADESLAQAAWAIARSLAFLCLHQGKLTEKKLADQAMFLEAVGLSTAEQAGLLGSTTESIKELKRLARKSRGDDGKKGKGKRPVRRGMP